MKKATNTVTFYHTCPMEKKLEFHGEGAERAPETFFLLIADEIGSAGSIGSKKGAMPER